MRLSHRTKERSLVISVVLTLLMALALPVLAGWVEQGTQTCTGSYNPQTKITANGSVHWHEHDGNLVYKVNPNGPNFLGVTYRESIRDQSINYRLGFTEDAIAPGFDTTWSYARCIH